MISWSYEKEQERLERLWQECKDNPEDEAADSDSSLEDGDFEVMQHESESEQDVSENEADEGQTNNETDFSQSQSHSGFRQPCFISKDGTRWRKHLSQKRKMRTRAINIITQVPGVRGEAREKKEPVDIWALFLTDQMLQNIVHYTNSYIRSKNYSKEYRTARETDIIEIKALLGLFYIAGAIKSSRQTTRDLFRTNGMSYEIFRLTMSEERFKFLQQNIRFDDKMTRANRQEFDKLAAIREFFDEFNDTLAKYFSMSKYTTIDEMLLAFRGRCNFKIYIPSKPNRYGIKVYSLADAKMFYTFKLEIYAGQQPPGPYRVNTSNMALVPRLCQPIWDTKRNITMDNFFTSTALAETLMRDHKLTMIGTIRKNKPQIPSELIIKRPEKTTMFAFRENCTLLSYIPRKNKNVFLLTTIDEDDNMDEETGKPKLIIDYNKTKGGVDMVDKLCESYNCARITRRWPLVVFFGCMNVAGINSFVIYKCNNIDKHLPRRLFLENLGMNLVEKHVRRRLSNKSLPRSIRMRICEIYSITEENEPPKEVLYSRCNYCSVKKNRKTKYSCHFCNKFMCLEHLTPLCLECRSKLNT